MNRRQFIKYSGIGLMVLGGIYIVNPLAELKTVARKNLYNYLPGLDDDRLEIIYLAALAPSGHNTQPWTVRILDENHWLIGTESGRWLPAVDPENREVILSLGAFLENMVVAAGVKGYAVAVEIVGKKLTDTELLDIKLHKVKNVTTFDLTALKLRRTVRNNFLTSFLSNEDIRFLTEENKESCLYYSQDSKEGNYLAKGTLVANQLQAYRNPAQEELAKWIRWSNHDIEHYRNGLTPETMEIEGISRWYVKNFYSIQTVLEKSFREATIKRIQAQVTVGSGWLVITSKDSSIPELIAAGRKLQRIWLQARNKKIALHPMSQILEEEPMQQEIASALGIRDKIQFIVRIGYINNYPQPVSPRMPVNNIILS